jgi:hypothetical protein
VVEINKLENGVTEIFLDQEFPFEHKIGQFMEMEDADMVIDYDCDVYMPNEVLGGDPRDPQNLLCKYRTNVYTKEEQKFAYDSLHEGAIESQNRGLAAGPRGGKLGTRDWVTHQQIDLLGALAKGDSRIDGTDVIDEIMNDPSYKGIGEDGDKRGIVWLISKVKDDGFVWEDWVNQMRELSIDERKKEANRVLKKYVSDTTYANAVNSGVAGYFDRYPRIPYCRATAYTANNPEKWEKCLPFIEKCSETFRELVPTRWAAQKKACEGLDDNFIIGDSVFTTLTINKNFRTAAHYDAGDLHAGFGNIIALDNGIPYEGGVLIFPRYRVGLDFKPGGHVCFNVQGSAHGNTELILKDGGERVTVVMYFREKLSQECEGKEIEDLRFDFVEKRRKDPNHPLQRPLWNGISPSMWEDDEWIEFLLGRGYTDYVQEKFPEYFDTGNSLENFF